MSYVDEEHKQVASSASKDDADVGDPFVHDIGTPLFPKVSDAAASGSNPEVRTASAESSRLADHPERSFPRGPSQGPLLGASVGAISTRAYDARFACPAVCVCAEHRAVQAAVQHLVGAVRETAAVLTRLHSEDPIQQQCALLGRMFEFDCFLS